MMIQRCFATLLLAALPTGCYRDANEARAALFAADGRKLGTATFRAVDEGVLVTIHARELTPGEHVVNIHDSGDCSASDLGRAGGHFDPSGARHGLADGVHAADMPNLVVDDAGEVVAHRLVRGASLRTRGKDASWSLLRPGGTALVLQAEPDDHFTDPAGAASPRILCGVVHRTS